MRCVYCMPEKMTFLKRKDVLTYEEIVRCVKIFVELGVSHVRLTGGEPLARRHLVKLVRMLTDIPGVKDLSMTTNGMLLGEHAQALADAGLERVNVSLDTLDPAKFKAATRWGELEPVLNGIRAARDAGLTPVKLNAVLVRGVNEDEAAPLIRFARDEGLLLRFIEFMPVGIDDYWTDDRFLKIDEMRASVEKAGFTVHPIAPDEEKPVGGGPAKYWHVIAPDSDTPSKVGFIAALTHNFCETCNRVRLASDGRVRECLSSGGDLSMRDMMREGKSDDEMLAALQAALYGKVDGHGFDGKSGSGGLHTLLPMSALGG